MQAALSLEDRIKHAAGEIGFSLCRITSADPPPHHAYFQTWLGDGNHGEMTYLERHEPKRGDLSQVVPGAKSVVVVAMSYAQEDDVRSHREIETQPAENTGTIARYARLNDYHNVMTEKLGQLVDAIVRIAPGTSGKAYCDTGPISERDLAERAGIGWVGKHASLISRELGNWFFLGEVIVDCALAADPPESKHCGTCQRCLPACPTGAITAPYHLDARRCIAYLTIELKSSIPVELRPLIGNRIFGCDDCLAVCPWNKFAKAATSPQLAARNDLKSPDLIPLLTLTEAEFKERFANSPILRSKRRGFVRNVCVALGNIGDRDTLPALATVRESDPEPLVREHAEWAILQIEART